MPCNTSSDIKSVEIASIKETILENQDENIVDQDDLIEVETTRSELNNNQSESENEVEFNNP